MKIKTRLSFLAISILASAPAFAFSQLVCNVSEDVSSPLQSRSNSYTVTAPLSGADATARIDLDSTNFNLSFGVETFLSEVTSPGQQVILIGIHDNKDNKSSTTDGHGYAATFYDTEVGTLYVQCTVN